MKIQTSLNHQSMILRSTAFHYVENGFVPYPESWSSGETRIMVEGVIIVLFTSYLPVMIKLLWNEYLHSDCQFCC